VAAVGPSVRALFCRRLTASAARSFAVCRGHPELEGNQIKLTYQDDDDDWVTLRCELALVCLSTSHGDAS
jgi:hypothetical protein